ncbi:hypothetical protein DXG01_007377 [Tephrocybe rancida]|nr:hypothetical protein DXG01_007377 [Tephrocybe rancida]
MVYIGIFAQENDGDVAIRGFIPKLKKHLLPRIRSTLSSLQPLGHLELEACAHWESVHFKQERIYKHNILRVRYTTYDVRQGEDIIHVNTWKRNIMVLNPSFMPNNGEHPFWYAQILSIYHANVFYLREGNSDYYTRRLEFLWVRWFSPVEQDSSQLGVGRLHRIKFPTLSDQDSFGFLDPVDVIHACHIIPRFSGGKALYDVRGMSRLAEDICDWDSYYVNRFVDRDMFMRYLWGLLVGHVYSHAHGQPHEQEERQEVDSEDTINDISPDNHGERLAPGLHSPARLLSVESIGHMDEEVEDVKEGFSSGSNDSDGWGTDSDSDFESEQDEDDNEADF